MSNLPTNFLAFIIVLGFLIFAHEAGHFMFAKLFRVRVLVFSFGFGKRLFGFRRGDTDYRVSLIPLGGYVRMAGDTPEENQTGAEDEFLSKPKWQRFLILFAGPAMNVLIAIAFMAIIAMAGTEQAIIPNIVGRIIPGGAAEQAGLKSGDTIVRVGSEPIADFDDMLMTISMNAGTRLEVEYIRNGQRMRTFLTPKREQSEYGPVGRAGIVPRRDPVIGRVVPGSHAEKAGIRTGDRIVAVNGKPITDLVEFADVIAKAPEAPLVLEMARGAERFTANLPKVQFDPRNPYRGFYPPTEVRKLSLIPAIKDSIEQNRRMLRLTGKAIARLFRPEGSIKELSGPLSIARISGDMLRRGWMETVALMAMISLQLGIMNLLPIPVLDGGHIAILLVEGVARRDLSIRVKERIQQLGFAVLAALMLVVLYHDVITNVLLMKKG